MSSLPIESVLNQLVASLSQHDQLILEAPPGAGKTTMVPLALLDQPWARSGKIVMLEPRRIAARQAAERMAELLGEEVGETVGYRVRMDNKVSAKTRIEVITEGVLNRLLLDNPSLEGIAALIFDEFHERSLDGDVGLALTLQGRQLFGDLRDTPLKLIVMSATLDGSQLQAYLETASGTNCPIVSSEGRMFPVDIRWMPGPATTQLSGYARHQSLIQHITQTIEQALADQTGSILVFLPGQKEIHDVQYQLQQRLVHSGIHTNNALQITPLYGALSLAEQRKAIQPAADGIRKVVLTTSIAETSLTIEGVRVVIDSGLARVPEYDPKTAMTRLKTERVSKASAKQRTGRAGRLEPGVCYRLWSEEQHQSLSNFTAPEIDQADLTPLVLQLIQWGLSNPNELDWLTAPKPSAYQQALDLLIQLNAVTEDGTALTAHGESMTKLAMHPRFAHMLIKSTAITSGASSSATQLACRLAALLSERDPLTGDAELTRRLALFETKGAETNSSETNSSKTNSAETKGPLMKRIKMLSKQFEQQLSRINATPADALAIDSQDVPGVLTALAYPDRIAQVATASNSELTHTVKLSNGRQAQLNSTGGLAKANYLAVAQLGGRVGQSTDRIFLATRLNINALRAIEPTAFKERVSVIWNDQQERLIAEKQVCIGKLICESKPLHDIPEEQHQQALLNLVQSKGLSLLPWTQELTSWCQRIELLREIDDQHPWPDMSESGLLRDATEWLGPYLSDIRHINHFKKLDLKSILAARLHWPLPQLLDEHAPERYRVPSGSNIKIDYSQSPPVLAVKLQEMFGQTDTPSIAQGKVKLLVHLLSPAQRPLQVTQDLAGFWHSSYELVKKDMKGRYPKHHWPDNPLEAEATARAKPRKH